MRVKTVPAQIKMAEEKDGADSGEFEAIVSAFGNTDAVGDIVLPGAFEKSLDRWGKSGDPIPVIWSHDHNNPDAHIGAVSESKETDKGLWVKGLIDMDEPFAAKVFRLMKSRRVTKFSFAYDMKDYEENDQGGFDLKELEVWEVGPTLIPANAETELLAGKNLLTNEGVDLKEVAQLLRELKTGVASGMKAGRVLSAKNEALLSEVAAELKSATDKLSGLVKSVQSSGDSDEGKARGGQPAGDEGKPADAKAGEAEEQKPAPESQPAKSQPAAANILMDLQLLELEAETY
jgi:uncharacterized protein